MSRKRWIALLLFIVLFAVYAVFQTIVSLPALGTGLLQWNEEVFQEGGPERVALLRVEGTILEGSAESFISGSFYNHRLFLQQLKHAFQDETVKAIILRVNSPGGGVVESDEIYQTIMKLKEEYKKPVVVSMGSMAASGGYYISAAADKIVAASGTITGSIGVIISSYNVKELADRWGIKEEAVTSGPNKNMLSPFQELSPEEREILQNLVNEAHQKFVEAIVQGRGMDERKVRTLADGRIYSGEQALEAGLVDALGHLDEAIGLAAQLANIENPTVITYSRSSFSLVNTFMSKMIQRTDLGWEAPFRLDSTPKVMYLLNW